MQTFKDWLSKVEDSESLIQFLNYIKNTDFYKNVIQDIYIETSGDHYNTEFVYTIKNYSEEKFNYETQREFESIQFSRPEWIYYRLNSLSSFIEDTEGLSSDCLTNGILTKITDEI